MSFVPVAKPGAGKRKRRNPKQEPRKIVRMNRSRGLASLLALSGFLAGCAAGPSYQAPLAADLGVPAGYSGAAAGTGPLSAPLSAPLSDADLAGWWRRFDDPALDSLVERAMAANLDIRQAEARLRQAEEASVQAGAGFFPSVSASGSGGRNFSGGTAAGIGTGTGTGGTGTGGGGSGNRLSASLSASWQVDLFGGLRRGLEAARAGEAASRYSLADVRVTVVSSVVTNYLQLRLAQEQLRIARLSLGNQRDNRAIAGWRVQAGLGSSLDEEQARAQLAQTEAGIPAIEAEVKNRLNQIAILTGDAPGAATLALEEVRPLPAPPRGIAVGIPADTLRQRPDVRAAERNLAAATAQVGVAEAALLPSLSLTGSVGSSAVRFGDLFDVVTGSAFASIGQLLFDGGARSSQVRARKAAADGAFAAYKAVVLQALADVENGLTAAATADSRETQLKVAAEAADNSAILARMQYQSGVTDFQTLLLAEQTLLSANNALAAGEVARSLAVVQLYNALGGGWQNMDGTNG